MKITRTMLGLFLSYLVLAVVMLAVSYSVTHRMIADMRDKQDEKMEEECERIMKELNERLILYQDKAIRLSTIDKLSAEKMYDHGPATREGIDYLKNVKMMDVFWHDIILSYGDNIYTGAGYSRPHTYIKRTLGCSEETAALGEKILKEDKNAVVYLNAAPYGYLLLHYPIEKNKDGSLNSVDYCIRMDAVYELLEPLTEEMPVCIQITFKNDWQREMLYLRGIGEEGIYEINEEDSHALLAEKGRVTATEKSELLGMELQVSYSARDLYDQVTAWKRALELGMGIFAIFAVAFSYRISKWQYSKIHFLKESLRDIWPHKDASGIESKISDFDTMQDMIQGIGAETNRMRAEAEQAREIMRQQMAMLLFYGGIREKGSITGMLESCGVELQEPYFAIVCITVENEDGRLPETVMEYTRTHFGCVGSIEGRRAAIVLFELAHEDLLKKQREKMAQMLLKEASGKGELKIAFSQTYENILRAPGAYLEAAGLCQRLLHTEKQCVAYMDTVIDAGQRTIRFREGDMEEFENAVMAADIEQAQKGLDRLLAFVDGEDFLEENKEYLRYCIAQSVVLCLKNREEYRDTELIGQLAACDIQNGTIFAEQIRQVLTEVCRNEEKAKKVRFSQIVKYINANYHRYDLSLEDVAEYAGLSKSYMSRLFKEKTGSRYIEYLTRCRMEQAKRLLEETNLGIKEISLAVGYNNVPGFRSKFKEYCGINASEYRKQCHMEERENDGICAGTDQDTGCG